MNHPTDELETLLSCAEEAMAEDDYEEAVVILKQAASVAPLRRDVRNLLAMALQGVPDRPKKLQQPVPSQRTADHFPVHDYPVDDDMAENLPGSSASTQRAFRAVADTTVLAGEAGRTLTNLVQNGLQSWKSSLLGQVQSLQIRRAVPKTDPGAVAGSAEAGLFTTHSQDISDIMGPAPALESVPMYRPVEEMPADAEIDTEDVETERIAKSAPVSRKASPAPASSSKKPSRPTDMEDVLAAGFGSLIEAVTRANKKTFVFAGVYVALGMLFGFACFDAARKFPGVEMVPGQGTVSTASMGALDLSGVAGSPVAEARRLVSSGQPERGINLLKASLLDGKVHPANDPIRIELAAQLNAVAENKLRANQLKESVNNYREAVGVMPDDSGLTLRLANALYYYAIMTNLPAEDKAATIKESLDILDKLVARGSDNLQVYRLRALLQEAANQTSQAKASWQKVKALAPEKSAEHSEAAARLK